ncbi:hypothetical protein TNCV_4714251 [Trichonephila clavipes]|nr:hypothetical protein TNCV_4714251 [Trichonephila clavipes]
MGAPSPILGRHSPPSLDDISQAERYHRTFTSVTDWTPSSVLKALHFSGYLDYKFGHINPCLDTIKCTYSAALQVLFGLQVQLHQSMPGHPQVYLQRCFDSNSFIISAVLSCES